MGALIGGEAAESQIGAALAALASKGATGEELEAFARVLRGRAVPVPEVDGPLLDTCGTGGGAPSFNISTAAAIVAAAAGVRVAKHGNRAVTSACGSADVLEALGVRLASEPEGAATLLRSVGIAFLFAPAFHPALKSVGKVRKELGVRTVFNQLGPLANPAGASRQLVGVYDASLVRSMAEALASLGCESGLVVHGEDGLDEVSPCGPSLAWRVDRGTASETSLSPSDFDLPPVDRAAVLPGENVAENAAILREAISDASSARCAAVLPSASAAIWLGGAAASKQDAGQRAFGAVASGAASAKLESWIEASQEA